MVGAVLKQAFHLLHELRLHMEENTEKLRDLAIDVRSLKQDVTALGPALGTPDTTVDLQAQSETLRYAPAGAGKRRRLEGGSA